MRDEASGAIGAIAKLPIFLDLNGRRATLAGDTPGLAWKAELIAAAGAEVTVFAPAPCEELRALARRGPAAGSVTIVSRDWMPADLVGAAIAVADLHGLDEAAAFKQAAVAAGVIANTVDKGATCDFYFGAVVSRTPLMIGATTDGTAPILGQAVRRAIELAVPDWLGPWLEFAREIRPQVKAGLAPGAARRGFWEAFTQDAWAGPLDDDAKAATRARLARAATTATPEGCVHRLRAPDSADALTIGDAKKLQSADLIIEAAGAARAARVFYRREASRLVVGRAGVAGEIAPEAVEATMAEAAAQGRRVVMLEAAA